MRMHSISMHHMYWRTTIVALVYMSLSLASTLVSATPEGLVGMYSAIRKWEKSEYDMHDRLVDVLNNTLIQKCHDSAYVTFVMPTSGSSPAIVRAIQSVLNLHDCNWRLIVVYSVVEDRDNEVHQQAPFQLATIPQYIWQDLRIYFLPYKNLLPRIYGGSQRNHAFRHVVTPWIAFLDEDDTITADYVTLLKEEVQAFSKASAVLFRASCITCEYKVIPPETHHTIDVDFAGISFAVRRELMIPLGSHQFQDGPVESYKLLHDMMRSGVHLVLSGSVTYLMKGSDYKPSKPMSSTLIQATSDEDKIEYKQPILRPILGFDFPEKDSIFFGSNVRGLQQALERVRKVGCVDSAFFDFMEVEVHFGFGTSVVDRKKLFIQVQVEQIHNRTVPRTGLLVFSPQYLQKMRRASQVWAIAPSHYRFLTQALELTNVFYVPLWHMTESNLGGEISLTRKERARQVVPTKEQQCVAAVVHPIIFNGTNYTVEDCVLYPANCPETGHTSGISLCKRSRVLFFGAIRFSHNGRRERLCQIMSDAVDDFVCYEGVFGVHLRRLVDSADIIVLDRYYSISSLESHRIDPLLLKGKVVVSTHSFDKDLELAYKSVVVFVDRIEDMPNVVNKLLTDQDMLKRLSLQSMESIQKKDTVGLKFTIVFCSRNPGYIEF